MERIFVAIVTAPEFPRTLATGVLLNGGVLWLWFALHWQRLVLPAKKALLGTLVGVGLTVPLAADTGRMLMYASPIVAAVLTTVWANSFSGQRRSFVFLTAMLGNAILSATVVLRLPGFVETMLVAAGVVLQASMLLVGKSSRPGEGRMRSPRPLPG